jgi:hypothetical protein
MSAETPDGKVAASIIPALTKDKLILPEDSQKLQEGLTKGSLTAETWTRIAEKAIDAPKKGVKNA